MTELACSANLVPAYFPTLLERMFPAHESDKDRPIVFIVCGGVKISPEEVWRYEAHLQAASTTYPVWIDGEEIALTRQGREREPSLLNQGSK